MRFEPKLYREDDDPICQPAGASSDELSTDLPDELAAIGAQLSDDAAALALAFPARRPLAGESEPDSSLHRKRRWLRWTGAAAVLLIAVGTWRVIDDQTSRDDSPPSHAVSAIANGRSSTDRPLAVVERPMTAAKPMAEESGLPASIFRGLTGAEQEAVLDLMQDGAQQHLQLTI
jgi:hypothetical protein